MVQFGHDIILFLGGENGIQRAPLIYFKKISRGQHDFRRRVGEPSCWVDSEMTVKFHSTGEESFEKISEVEIGCAEGAATDD